MGVGVSGLVDKNAMGLCFFIGLIGGVRFVEMVAGGLAVAVIGDFVQPWAEQQAGGGDQHQAAIEGVEGGEDFYRVAGEWGDGAHAAEDHRGFEEGIDPVEMPEDMVAEDADEQRGADERYSQQQ